MELKKGLVVISKAGRDKGGWFIILDYDQKYVYIADGREHLLESPKKKNILHIQCTKKIIPVYNTNAGLWKNLCKLKKS